MLTIYVSPVPNSRLGCRQNPLKSHFGEALPGISDISLGGCSCFGTGRCLSACCLHFQHHPAEPGPPATMAEVKCHGPVEISQLAGSAENIFPSQQEEQLPKRDHVSRVCESNHKFWLHTLATILVMRKD